MKHIYISTDVEADGPIPGEYSMIWFGSVIIRDLQIGKSFEAKIKPISDKFVPEALAVSDLTREETLRQPEASIVMQDYVKWIKENTQPGERPIFVSDNNGFDWMFVCYYLWKFAGENPYGYTSMNIGWLYKGLVRDTRKSFKHLRTTRHDHNPVNDATGNAEALIQILGQLK